MKKILNCFTLNYFKMFNDLLAQFEQNDDLDKLAELFSAVGIDSEEIEYYKAGERIPPMSSIMMMMFYLNLRLDDILITVNDMPHEDAPNESIKWALWVKNGINEIINTPSQAINALPLLNLNDIGRIVGAYFPYSFESSRTNTLRKIENALQNLEPAYVEFLQGINYNLYDIENKKKTMCYLNDIKKMTNYLRNIGLVFANLHMDWDCFRSILEDDNCNEHYTEALDMLIQALENRKLLPW